MGFTFVGGKTIHYPTFTTATSAADLNKLPHGLREEMKELRREVASYMRRDNEIPKPPRRQINEFPASPRDGDVTILVGDSVFNDGKERETRNMILLSLVRDQRLARRWN